MKTILVKNMIFRKDRIWIAAMFHNFKWRWKWQILVFLTIEIIIRSLRVNYKILSIVKICCLTRRKLWTKFNLMLLCIEIRQRAHIKVHPPIFHLLTQKLQLWTKIGRVSPSMRSLRILLTRSIFPISRPVCTTASNIPRPQN